MHLSEIAQMSLCAECGEEIWPERERSFLMDGSDDALCYGCASRRGGAYDELNDTWVQTPDLSGLSVNG